MLHTHATTLWQFRAPPTWARRDRRYETRG